MDGLMKINDAAKKYSVSIRTLRYYEEIKLIESIRCNSSNVRSYNQENLTKIEQIILLKSVGFALTEIKKIINSDDCDDIKLMLEEKHRQLNRKIEELVYSKDILSSFLEQNASRKFSKITMYHILSDMIYNKSHERIKKMEEIVAQDIFAVELGLGITQRIDIDVLIRAIKAIRDKTENETGVTIPLIRLKDNQKLDAFQYTVSVKGMIKVNKNDLCDLTSTELEQDIIQHIDAVVNNNIDELT